MGTSDKFDGPSGVLVCTEDHIIYRHMDAPQHRVPIPRRHNPAGEERGLIIGAAVTHKMKGAFFFLLQSEEGDLYKVTIEHEEQEVRSLKIKYFDTVPVASSLCILKSGFLFVAAEFGNQLGSFSFITDLILTMCIQPFVPVPKIGRRRQRA